MTEGKGGKQRLVPIVERALSWIRKYKTEVRDSLTCNRIHDPNLFLSSALKPMVHINQFILDYKIKAGINKKGLSHLFRHTMATLMLKNGADIRIIQQILGHSHLHTTQRYTHLCIEHLKEVHEKTHPAKYPNTSTHHQQETP